MMNNPVFEVAFHVNKYLYLHRVNAVNLKIVMG